MRPAIKVSNTLIITRITPPAAGRVEFMAEIPVRSWIMTLMGMFSSRVAPMPMTPAVRPIIKVSALKTRDTSRLEAPMALSMPIYLVRSRTLM